MKFVHDDRWRSMRGKHVKLVFIGDKFYMRSGTSMSSIYQIVADGVFSRFDYGFLQCVLEQGNTVDIRLATDSEQVFFQKELDRIEDENRERKAKEMAKKTRNDR